MPPAPPAAQAAGRQAEASFANAESQRLAAESSGVLQRGESAERAALLALRGLQIHYTPPGRRRAPARQSRLLWRTALSASRPRRCHRLCARWPHLSKRGRRRHRPSVGCRERQGNTRSLKATATASTRIVFSPDGSRVLTANLDKTVRVWDVQTGRELRRFEQPEEVSGSLCARWYGSMDRRRREERSCGRSIAGRCSPHRHRRLAAVGVSPDGVYLLTSHPDGGVQLWDARSGQPLRTLNGLTVENSQGSI